MANHNYFYFLSKYISDCACSSFKSVEKKLITTFSIYSITHFPYFYSEKNVNTFASSYILQQSHKLTFCPPSREMTKNGKKVKFCTTCQTAPEWGSCKWVSGFIENVLSQLCRRCRTWRKVTQCRETVDVSDWSSERQTEGERPESPIGGNKLHIVPQQLH